VKDALGQPMIVLCWNCNRRFHGNTHEVVRSQGHERRVHVSCAAELRKAGQIDTTP
jgi:hypothetical protein